MSVPTPPRLHLSMTHQAGDCFCLAYSQIRGKWEATAPMPTPPCRHVHCFKCAGCGRPLAGAGGGVEFTVSSQNGLPYHPECHRDQFHPRCRVCGDFLPVEVGGHAYSPGRQLPLHCSLASCKWWHVL